MGGDCEMRGSSKRTSSRSPSSACPSGCPCPRQNNAADCLSAFTGSAGQKGRVMGILRSLGALARALGPILSATGERGPSAFLLLPRSLGEGGRRGGNQEGKPQPPAQSPKTIFAEGDGPKSCLERGRARALLASTGASWMN